MTSEARLWHTLTLELGRQVVALLGEENDPTSTPVLRRLDIGRRARAA